MCLLCVSIRAYAKPPNVTLGYPDKLLQKSPIFPGIPSALPSSSSAPLKEVGLGLSPATPALIDAHNTAVCPSLFTPIPFRRTVQSAGFPSNYPASALHSQAAFPGLDFLRTRRLRLRLGGGWCSRRPLLPLGPERAARWARVRARARACWGNLLPWKLLSVADQEYPGVH